MEQEIAKLRSNLSQHAEENKGLILMQDCHIRQIQELKQLCQSKDDEIKEMKLQTDDYKMMADEVMTAREKTTQAENSLEFKASELAQFKRNYTQTIEGLKKQIESLQEDLEGMQENERHF